MHRRLSLLLPLALVACDSVSTISTRIREMGATFATATPAQQTLMRQGFIDRGFTPNMVYISIDKPDRVTKSADDIEETWVYNNFDSAGAGNILGDVKISQTAGYEKLNPASRAARGQYQNYDAKPDVSSGPAPAGGAKLLITFVNGFARRVELQQ